MAAISTTTRHGFGCLSDHGCLTHKPVDTADLKEGLKRYGSPSTDRITIKLPESIQRIPSVT